jgi:hypothetical protein
MTLDEEGALSAEEREAIEFLKRGRKLRGLSSTQFQRIERRLEHPSQPRRARTWLPALAVLCLVLITGTALARVSDLSRLPLVGPLFSSGMPAAPPEQHRPTKQPRTARAADVAPPVQPEPTVSPLAQEPPPLPPVAAVPPAAEPTTPTASPAAGARPGTAASLPAPVVTNPAASPTSRTGAAVARPQSDVPRRRSALIGEPKAHTPFAQPEVAAIGEPLARPIQTPTVEPPPAREPASVAPPTGSGLTLPRSVAAASSGDQARQEPGQPAVFAAPPPVGGAVVEPPPARSPAPVPSTTNQALGNQALGSMPGRTAPVVAPENPITAENRSFSAALAEWRRAHNAAAALAALDWHERRFAQGQFQLEAKLLRAEIFLKQGREREVLALLDDVPLRELPRGRELQTVRGELRIKHGRCAEGRSDLSSVVANSSTDSLGRRAAHAMSLCP